MDDRNHETVTVINTDGKYEMHVYSRSGRECFVIEETDNSIPEVGRNWVPDTGLWIRLDESYKSESLAELESADLCIVTGYVNGPNKGKEPTVEYIPLHRVRGRFDSDECVTTDTASTFQYIARKECLRRMEMVRGTAPEWWVDTEEGPVTVPFRE